jgi:hypothetical protein
VGNNSHRRTWDDLVAQADALLGCGNEFWLQSGLGLGLRKQLGSALAAARDGECAFCGALAARLDAMVRRQAAQQKAYDFLAECRRRLKALPATEWVRVPAEAEEQVFALQEAARHLQGQAQDSVTGLTGGRADQIRHALEAALHNVDLSSGSLRAAATTQRITVDVLHQIVTNISRHLRARLRSGDPRWLGLTRVNGNPKIELHQPEPATPVQQCGNQSSLNPEGEGELARGARPKTGNLHGFKRLETPRRTRKQLPLDSLKLMSALALLFPPAE